MECILSLQFPNGNQYCTFPFFKKRIRYSNLFPISVYAYIILLRSSLSFELFYPWVFLVCAEVSRQVGTLLDAAWREKRSNSIIFISASTGTYFWSMYDNREAHTTSLRHTVARVPQCLPHFLPYFSNKYAPDCALRAHERLHVMQKYTLKLALRAHVIIIIIYLCSNFTQTWPLLSTNALENLCL